MQLAFIWLGRWAIPRLLAWTAALSLALTLAGSAFDYRLDPVEPRTIAIAAKPYRLEGAMLSKRLRFVRGWVLTSPDGEFGGLSALAMAPLGLSALSDRGAIFAFSQDASGKPLSATLRPLPRGCGDARTKLQRDSEALARDPVSGDYWIGLEWQNALCHSGASLAQGKLIKPAQMAHWRRTKGPESVARLSDGRTIVIAESAPGGDENLPLLIFGRDPAPDVKALARRYITPPGYAPTDIAELPDGGLVVVHRQFRLPFDFRTIVSIIPKAALDGTGPIHARPIALFRPPGLSDNFEGVAVEVHGPRTFIWLVSDDNFVLTQKTYLLKFELSGGGGGVR